MFNEIDCNCEIGFAFNNMYCIPIKFCLECFMLFNCVMPAGPDDFQHLIFFPSGFS